VIHVALPFIEGQEKGFGKQQPKDELSYYELVNPSRELDKRDNFAHNGVYLSEIEDMCNLSIPWP
jgi:hypothetical protein